MAKSLAGCAAKIGAALDVEDMDAAYARAGTLHAEGKSPADAAAEAVQERLKAVRAMLIPTSEPEQNDGLTLEAPTRAQVLAQQDALEQERAARDAPADKPRSRLKGEQVDIFNPQGSVFDVPAQADSASVKARDDAGNEPMFSRATTTGTKADIARVTSTAEAIASLWTNKPDIVVFGDMQDKAVPASVRARDAQQRSQGATGDPGAFYAGGKVYLHAGMLKTPMDVAEALYHEALGHAGLRGHFGPGLDSVLDRMAASYNQATLQAKAIEYGQAVTDKAGKFVRYKDEQARRTTAQEVLAELAQTRPTSMWVQRAIAAIRTWLRENIPGFKDLALSDAEVIRSFIAPARGFIERGPAMAGADAVPAFQRAWHGTHARGIDRFDTDMIGTGEGAQAYGWGLYFAGRKEVGEYYRMKLAGDGSRAFSKDGKTIDDTIDLMEAYYQPGRLVRGYSGTDKVMQFERNDRGGWNVQVVGVKANGEPMQSERPRWHSTQPEGALLKDVLEDDGWKASKPGQLYEVDIPEDSELLLWDKPLSEQPEKVRATLNTLNPQRSQAEIDRAEKAYDEANYAYMSRPADLPDAQDKSLRDAAGKTYEAWMKARGFYGLSGSAIYRKAGATDRAASEALAALGIKGIKYPADQLSGPKAVTSYNYVIFSGDDVAIRQQAGAMSEKAAGGMPMFSRSADKASKAEPGRQAMPPAETRRRAVQRVMQDQFNRFTVVRNWAVEQGANMTPDSDVWAYEQRMHGRIATRVEDFREKRMKPAIKAIQKAGFTMDQAAEFLHAQHAKERNDQIKSVDPTTLDGSGMKTADAAAILANADPKLAALANDLRKITDDTKAILLDAGIINKDMTDAWEGAYKHYVPLKGADKAAQAGTGKGLGVAGKQKRALGHGARSEHIIENMLRDHERAITLAEKNRVGLSLLAMIFDMNNQNIATVGQPEKRKVLKSSTQYEVVDGAGARLTAFDTLNGANAFIATHSQPGLFGTTAGPLTARAVKGDPTVAYMAAPMLAANEVNVYVNGYAVRVQLHDDLLARAYTKAGVESLNWLMAMNREINTYFSKVYTGYNPEFLFANMARDWTTGLINVTGQYGIGIAGKSAVDYPRAFAQLLRYNLTGKSTPDIDAYRASGGSTGAAYLSDIERIGRDVGHAYDEYRGVIATLKGRGAMAAGRVAARKLAGYTIVLMEHLNAAGENAMRLAVFEAVRDTKGYTVDDAADAAKNSTVNFNRRGEIGSVMGAMYLFFNPAIQGTAAMADALVNGKHRGQAIALTGAMGALAYMLAAVQFGSDDDEEEWRKIPDHVKDKNMIFRTGKKTYTTIPVPYGYGFFFALGNAIFDLRKGRDADEVSINVASNLLEHFSPIGNPLAGDKPSPAGLVELIPGAIGGELMRNVVRVAANRSSLGHEIVPESLYDKGKPDNQKLFRTTKGTNYDIVARRLNLMTGGTKSQSGGIDVSPETLKYWIRTLTGGAGAFVADTFDAGRSATQYVTKPDDPNRAALALERSEMPIARRFVKEETVKDARRVFWKSVEEAKAAKEDMVRAKKADDQDAILSIEKQKGELLAIAKYTDRVTKAIKAKRDVVDEVMADENTSRAYKRMRVKVLEKEETEMYDGYIKEFVIAKKGDSKTAATAK